MTKHLHNRVFYYIFYVLTQRKLSMLSNNFLSHSQEIGNDFYFFLDIMRETNAFESLNKQITNLLYSLLRKDGVYGRRQNFTQKFDFDFLLCSGSSGGIFLDYCYVDGEKSSSPFSPGLVYSLSFLPS